MHYGLACHCAYKSPFRPNKQNMLHAFFRWVECVVCHLRNQIIDNYELSTCLSQLSLHLTIYTIFFLITTSLLVLLCFCEALHYCVQQYVYFNSSICVPVKVSFCLCQCTYVNFHLHVLLICHTPLLFMSVYMLLKCSYGIPTALIQSNLIIVKLHERRKYLHYIRYPL